MQILPGILESSFEAIGERVTEVAHTADKVQVDVCDGLYVQSKTWPYSHIKTGRIEDNFHIIQLRAEEIGLPLWNTVEYQFDLMIKDPWRTIPVWAQIGATSVVIHPTSCDSMEKVEESITLAQSFLMDVYISYTYDEWVIVKSKPDILQALTDLLTTYQVKGFQCMTIKTIGVQGQTFDARWVDEFTFIQTQFPNIHIQLDGGIGEDAEDNIQDAHIDSLVIGSGIFKEGNPTENIEYYTKLFS
jgi:ribulose-phosphate 3-epimerase